jgi:hypothetical protein
MLHIIDRIGQSFLAPEQTNLEAPETVSSSHKTLSGTPNFSPIIAPFIVFGLLDLGWKHRSSALEEELL